jgi:hypothetical protein
MQLTSHPIIVSMNTNYNTSLSVGLGSMIGSVLPLLPADNEKRLTVDVAIEVRAFLGFNSNIDFCFEAALRHPILRKKAALTSVLMTQ